MTTSLAERTGLRPPLARLVWRHWVLGPLIFGLTALPLTLAGRLSTVAGIRRTWLDTSRTAVRTPSRSRATAVLMMLPLATVAFALTAVALMTVYTGELYPLRPETIGHLDQLFSRFPDGDASWGGPTLIGAWFVHALVGFGIQVLALAAVRTIGALSGAVGRP